MFYFDKKNSKPVYKLGVALSGGGARGFAHIGALRALEEFGMFPDVIAGTSAGAIVGALYADGHSPLRILQMFNDLNVRELVELTLSKTHLLKCDKLLQFLDAHLTVKNIEELRTPLKIIATDFDHGVTKVFDHGDLVQAIAASCAIPIVFPPVEIDGVKYVDGGVLRNLPVDPIRRICDQVIGINVTPMQRQDYPHNMISYAERAYNYLSEGNVIADKAMCDCLIDIEAVSDYSVFDIDEQKRIEALGYSSTRYAIDDLPPEARKYLNIK